MRTGRHRADILEEEAARWLIRREDPEWAESDAAGLSQWLAESVAHRAAFWRLEAGWRAADRISALGLSPEGTGFPGWLRSRPIGRTVHVATLAAAAAVAAVFALPSDVVQSVDGSGPTPATVYRTPIGGRKMVALADGSRVELNTATRIRVGAGTREVWLDQGEAFFDVAHRRGRRFVVHAGPRTVTVLGTRFSVRREGAKVTVAVMSGRVRIDDGDAIAASARTAVVAAGNVAVVESRSTLVTTTGQAEVSSLTAWREGMIVFDDTPLASAVDEFNRYAAHPIRIRDPELARLRIGGAFRTGDGRSFVSLLHRAYGIEVREEDGSVILDR